MKYLFKYRDNVGEWVRGRHVMLFLDYDGTLTPIADEPGKAVLSGAVKGLLADLSALSDCELAIISGRSLADVKKRVGLKAALIYSGNHGLEIEGPRIKFAHRALSAYGALLKDVKERLQKGLSGIKGVLIEDKGLSLAVHYRKAGARDIASIKAIFHEALADYKGRDKLRIKTGKMVLEVRPPVDWDKGDIVLWLLSRRRFALGERPLLPIYIGDDKADEDAFSALKNKGITVYVGRMTDASFAEYYLKDTSEVVEFLKLLLKEKRDEASV